MNFSKLNGLVPAIIQDIETKQVLMLGFQNQEAFDQTKKTGRVTFYSRTKDRLWVKGETSGNFLEVVETQIDCDEDTVLYQVKAPKETCHLGRYSCFGEKKTDLNFLAALENVIKTRLESGETENSYVKKLTGKGINKVAQKVGEEGVETCIAGINETDDELKNEAADLLFHTMILLQMRKIDLSEVVAIMEDRHQNKSA